MHRKTARRDPHGPRMVRLLAFNKRSRGLTLVHLIEPLFWMHHTVSDLAMACNSMNRDGANVIILDDRWLIKCGTTGNTATQRMPTATSVARCKHSKA